MAIEVTRVESYVTNLRRRMAFHFGNVSLTEGPHHFLDLELEIDGKRAEGISMVGMAPMWFLKDPGLSLADATDCLLGVFDAAKEHALEADPAPTVFDLWYKIYERQREWAEGTDHPPLLWAYGVSMIEQGLLDAVCRHEGVTFARAVREERLGIDPGRIYPELEGESISEYLPAEPTREAAVRHTVGLTDPLRDADLEPDDRLDDGLPQTLEEYIERDGVDHFKIKLSADPERDSNRLATIGEVLEESSLEEWVCTVDANEQYETVATFKNQWRTHADDPSLSAVLDAVAYVEQPLPRDQAFTDQTREVLSDWVDRPAIIIDESDDRLRSVGRALDCGYAGASHKNCKGVFKGVVNACLLEKRRREDDRTYVQSGEDLTTIGPVELLHDLAVMGTLGIDDIERNGHHYYRGLEYLPDDQQRRVLEAHSDLYRRHEDGFPTLNIDGGRIVFDSVIDAPFGRDFNLDPSRFTPRSAWTVESAFE